MLEALAGISTVRVPYSVNQRRTLTLRQDRDKELQNYKLLEK
jgi:hypothetical protein